LQTTMKPWSASRATAGANCADCVNALTRTGAPIGWAREATGTNVAATNVNAKTGRGSAPVGCLFTRPLWTRDASVPSPRHPRLHVLELPRDLLRDHLVAVGRDEDLVLDPHAEALLRKIDARLHREDGADGERLVVAPGV